MAAQLQMGALHSYMLCPQHPCPGHREVCAPTDSAQQMENVGAGAAKMSPRRKWVRGHTGRVADEQKGSGPGSSGARNQEDTLEGRT